MTETRQENKKQATHKSDVTSTEPLRLDIIKIVIYVVSPIILFLSGTTIWQSLNEIGLSHLFIETIKSNATLFTISAFLLVISYLIAIYIILLLWSFASLYHKGKSRYQIPLFLTLLLCVTICMILWFFFKWRAFKIAVPISYFIMVVYFYLSRRAKKVDGSEQNIFTKNMLMALVALTIVFTIPLTFFQPIGNQFILRMASFSQQPNDSSWYLLDEDYIKKFRLEQKIKNNKTQISQIQLLKERFVDSTQGNESYLSDGGLMYDDHPSALYGYFLWNVGDVRAFCPKSFDINSLEKPYGRKVASNCLIIKEQYLAPSVGNR